MHYIATLEHATDAEASRAAARSTRPDAVLTGDRPTGPLHLGHYVGSLQSRLALQGRYSQTLLIADMQALTDHAGRPAQVSAHVREVLEDYLAIGIDPAKTQIALQSGVPELFELTAHYLNLVTVARLERNPTVRAEVEHRGFQRAIPAGFLTYPVSQAADITGARGTLVPVGDDQLPMLEQTNEIIRRVNELARYEALSPCRPLLSSVTRLPGIDGRKASKSLGNAITLRATPDEVRDAVMAMYTDPDHARVSDRGRVEGNVVFAYLDAFDPRADEIEELKQAYRRGGLGDVTLKRRLFGVLDEVLGPIRERRAELAANPAAQRAHLDEVLAAGTASLRQTASGVVDVVRAVFRLPAAASHRRAAASNIPNLTDHQ